MYLSWSECNYLARKLRHVSWKETDREPYRRSKDRSMKHWVRVLIILFACLFPASVESSRVRHYKFNVSISMKYIYSSTIRSFRCLSCCGWVWNMNIGAWCILYRRINRTGNWMKIPFIRCVLAEWFSKWIPTHGRKIECLEMCFYVRTIYAGLFSLILIQNIHMWRVSVIILLYIYTS